MRLTFEPCRSRGGRNVSWLTLNKILCNYAQLLQLTPYIKRTLSTKDRWPTRSSASRVRSIVRRRHNGYGIHWGNEFWGAQTSNHSERNGEFVTKNSPAAGSLLHELYRSYGLIDPRQSGEDSVRRPSGFPLRMTALSPPSCPGRIAQEVAAFFQHARADAGAGWCRADCSRYRVGPCRRSEVDVTIYVRAKTPTSHEVPRRPNLSVVYLDEPGTRPADLAAQLVARGNPLIFTHLIKRQHLEQLWQAELQTVPVIHQFEGGMGRGASAYDHKNVPFVVACADSVRAEIAESGGPARILTIRHEISVPREPADLSAGRKRFAGGWGIGDETLVIGMIGQFKSQKAYTRAVRVLARVRSICQPNS